MYSKLTYLLIIIIAFIAVSCNSDPIDIRPTKGSELAFNVSNVSNLSRGSVTTSINQFVVYGDMSPVSETSAPVVLFNNTNVEYLNGRWCYDGTQYWIPNHEHSFVAISPGAIFETGTPNRYLNSQLSFEYSIPASGNGADILAATHRRLYVDGSDATYDNRITFTFNHLLSLINIAPAYDDTGQSNEECIMFHKLEFSGVNTKAQVDIMPAPRLTGSSTYDMDVNITGQGYSVYAIDFPMPVKVENNGKHVKLFADDDAVIMLPQTFTTDSEAEITLSYTINGDNLMNTVSIPLKNLKWESGKSYTYRFSIERSGIKIDNCEINPWNVIPGEEITVD